MKQWKAESIMILVVALWGITFSLTKAILDEIQIFNFMAMRFLIGGGILLLILFLRGKLKVDVNQLRAGVITGIVLFLGFTFHTIGLKYTSVTKNAFIVGSSVIFVPFIESFIRKNKQTKLTWNRTYMTILGLALVTLEGHLGGLNIGDIMSIIGSIILAVYVILVELYVSQYNATIIATIQISTVGILSLLVSLIFETPTIYMTQRSWWYMIYMGLLCTGIAYLIANIAQKYVPTTNMAIIYTLEPIFAAIFGWIFMSEIMGVQSMIGACIIIISVSLPNIIAYWDKRNNKIDIELT